MSANSNGTTVEQLQNISGIGPAFAERLVNAGFTSVDEVAEADEDVLASAIECSPSRASNIRDAATTLASDDDQSAPVDVDDAGRMDRIAVVWGKGTPEAFTPKEARELTKMAITDAGLDAHNSVIGIRGAGDGETIVRDTVSFLATNGAKVGMHSFDPQWDDYSQGEYADMFAVRDQAMFAWADTVVVVRAGDYTDAFLRRNYTDTQTHVFLEDGETIPNVGVTKSEPETTESGHIAKPDSEATDEDVNDAVKSREAQAVAGQPDWSDLQEAGE